MKSNLHKRFNKKEKKRLKTVLEQKISQYVGWYDDGVMMVIRVLKVVMIAVVPVVMMIWCAIVMVIKILL